LIASYCLWFIDVVNRKPIVSAKEINHRRAVCVEVHVIETKGLQGLLNSRIDDIEKFQYTRTEFIQGWHTVVITRDSPCVEFNELKNN